MDKGKVATLEPPYQQDGWRKIVKKARDNRTQGKKPDDQEECV